MTSTEPFQLTVRRRSEERSSRPATALMKASRSGDRLAVDLDDAAARPQLIARRRRAVREVRDEHAVRLDAALRRKRAMRLLQHRARPHEDAIEIAAAERDGRHIDDLLLARRASTVRRTDGFCTARSTSRKRFTIDAVDIEEQIARAQQLRRRRAADQPLRR